MGKIKIGKIKGSSISKSVATATGTVESEYDIGTIARIIDDEQKETENGQGESNRVSKKKKKNDVGFTQFDPNLNLANLFSSSTSNTQIIKTVVQHDTPAFQPITTRTKAKKVEKLKNKDAAQIRIDAKRKFSSHATDESINDSEKPNKSLKADKKAKKTKRKVKTQNNDSSNDDKQPDDEQESANEMNEVKTTKDDDRTKDSESKPKIPFHELNKPKPKNEELEARTCFIGNLPKSLAKKKQLMKIFRPFGKVESIRIRGVTSAKPTMLKKVALYKSEIHPNRSNVTAYVRYATREEAETTARETNGMKLQEHHLIVDLADSSLTQRDKKKAIFIGNLQLQTKEEDLWSFFEECGPIQSVRVVRDQSSGLGKGFGYINFQNTDSIELALTKNEEILNGRQLRVSRVVKKLKKGKAQNELDSTTKNKNRKGKDKSEQRLPTTSTNDKTEFCGDRTSEIGKLKKFHMKPNRDELKKARIAKQLMGNSQSSNPRGDRKSFKSGRKSECPKKIKDSASRKLHSKKRASQFKTIKKTNQNNAQKDEKSKKTTFKRYFSK